MEAENGKHADADHQDPEERGESIDHQHVVERCAGLTIRGDRRDQRRRQADDRKRREDALLRSLKTASRNMISTPARVRMISGRMRKYSDAGGKKLSGTRHLRQGSRLMLDALDLEFLGVFQEFGRSAR